MRRAIGCLIVGAAALAICWWSRSEKLPSPAIQGAAVPSPDRCAACHAEQTQSFQTSPHANTLRPMRDWPPREKLAKETLRLENGIVIHYQDWHDSLEAAADGQPLEVGFTWAFGSGRHAVTPVATLENSNGQTEVLEHCVSWYPDGQWNSTLGLDRASGKGIAALGKRHAPAESLRCFGCHTTRVAQEQGRIDFAHLIPNVQCDRCHPGTSRHVEHMELGSSEIGLLPWQGLTSLESINRCGECHRRADEFTADELKPDNKRLARFAPVGLSLSPCFAPGANQPADHADSLTCIRCHDPHQGAQTDLDFYRQRCLTCHAPEIGPRKPCSVQPPESLCTTCHMPTVALNPWLSFTDHWIRRRARESDSKR